MKALGAILIVIALFTSAVSGNDYALRGENYVGLAFLTGVLAITGLVVMGGFDDN